MNAPDLERLQTAIRQYLFSGANESELARWVADGNDIAATMRLDVYRNAYYIRLQEALAHDFPGVLALAGDKRFGQLTAGYLQAHPSKSPTLRDLGRSVSPWLRQQNKSLLADMAALEWAVLHAFDAADAPRLAVDDLASRPPEEWQQLRFGLHPSLTLLDLETNVCDSWIAMHRQQALPKQNDNARASVAVWRNRNNTPTVHSIDASCHTLLETLAKGQSFGQACVLLADCEGRREAPGLAAECLLQALARGWILA